MYVYFVSATPPNSHSVVVDSLFNVPPIGLFILRLWFLVCYVSLCALSNFAIILKGKRELAAFLIVFLMSKLYSVTLPHVAVGWSAF